MSKSERVHAIVAATAASTTIAPPPNHTAASLVERHGASERAAVAAFVWGATLAELHERGRRVSTARLVRDGVAMLGVASDFLLTATAEQRAHVLSIDGAFLSAASSALLHAEQTDTRLAKKKTARSSRRQALRAGASKAMEAGRKHRDIYRANLAAGCGDDAGWKGRIDDACGAVATPQELADSLDALATEGRALLAHLAAQKRPTAVDAHYLAAIAAYATRVRDDAAGSAGSASTAGTQRGDLDWWEGVGLWFLKTLRDVFERARAVDPSIPRLDPGGLRSTLTPNRTRKAKAPKPAAPTP